MCKKDDGVPTQNHHLAANHHNHTTPPQPQQQPQHQPQHQSQPQPQPQPQHQSQHQFQPQQQQQQVCQPSKQAESVEDGGGGDGGGGGGGDGTSVEEKQEVTTNLQVKVDAQASHTTTISDSSTEISMKTTTSKLTRTTKVKTIKIVKKKTTSSLIANAISDLNSKAEEPLTLVGESPKKVLIKRSIDTPPKKIPGVPKKIIKPVKCQELLEGGAEATASVPSPKEAESNKTKETSKVENPNETKVVGDKKSIVQNSVENKATVKVNHLIERKDGDEIKTPNKENSANKVEDLCEIKILPETNDSIKITAEVQSKESLEIKSAESKENIASVNSVALKDVFKASDSVRPKDSIEIKSSVSTKANDSTKIKESVKANDSVKIKESIKANDSVKIKESVQENDLVNSKDFVKSSDSVISNENNTCTVISVRSKDYAERIDTVKSNDPIKAEESIKLEVSSEKSDAVKPKETVLTNNLDNTKDCVQAECSSTAKESISDTLTTKTDVADETASSVKVKLTKPKKSTKVVNSVKSTDSLSAVDSATVMPAEASECSITVDSVKDDELGATNNIENEVDSDKAIENSEYADKDVMNDISSLSEETNVSSTSNDKSKFADADSLLDSELDNVSVFVIVRDMSGLTATVNKVTIVTPATSTCGELMQEVGRRFKYEPDSFSLVLQCSDGDQVEVDKMEAERTLADARFQVEGTPRNSLILCDLCGHPPRRTDDDDLSLGASASPTANATERKWFDRSNNYDNTPEYSYPSALIKHETGYAGLVNQAMTCYLNSLLQTLYMTPEFRNAIYQWEFKGCEDEASKNIPCQIQRLFLLLQTTNKSAVETTNLTRSFGWDSSEAWQQHDIQELCRVMFDALEQCFKNTHQSNLINDLYEGKMKDYVKCLQCGIEGAREDTYLDIPLPIRPFGSSTAYKSVEEALRAFVEPELLTGNNKYKCSKCDTLCDAHKGLKFTRFPYLLTIHLMRFDFDYQTLHRIKLNDKVTFPNILDLNYFIENTSKEDGSISTTAVTPDKQSSDKVDDASTTDSGSALDVEDSSVENTSNSQPESDNQDEDEGIDVSSMYNEKNKTWLTNGPYVYELFSIMIHSGSASGGHYYAYIKDFATGEWFCFNDQSVTKITYDDIRKTYGGNTSRGGYYSSWSSSANAYMLMYRQITKDRNVDAFTREQLPQHIKDLVQRMTEEEAAEREQRELERCTCRIKLFCQPPGQSQMVEKKLRVHKDSTLRETTKLAHKELGLENVVPVERCRLVKYEEFHNSLECSFEGQEDDLISEVLGGVRNSYKFDLLMEIRDEDKTFEVYKPGGTTIKAHVVNLTTEEVEGPCNLRGSLSMTVRDLKELLGRSLNLNPDTMRIVLERYYNDLRPLISDTKTLKTEGFYRSNKVYVEASGAETNDFFTGSCMYCILDRYENTITLYCPLPDTSKEALEELQIPPYKEEEVDPSGGESSNNSGGCGLVAVVSSAASPAESAASPASCSSKDSGISSKAPTDSSSSETESSSNSSIISPSGPCTSSLSTSSTIPASSPGSSSMQGSVGGMPGATATTPTASPTTTTGNGSDGEDEGIADADSGTSSSNVNSDQSASEDSSLTSDSDRTLVGDPPEDKLSDASNSPDYRNVSSPEDNGIETKDNEVVWGEDEKEVEVKRYFRAEYFTEEDTKQKMLRVYVDKRITVGQLKTEMQRWVGVSHEHFKLFKIYSNSQEFECTRMTETLASYGDNTRLSVRLGRALLPGEQRGKVYMLEPDNIDDPARFLIDWVVCKGDTVASAKKAIIKEVNARCNMSLIPENVRMRKKSWKNPQTIYLDNQKFDDDINLYSNWEIFLQVIEGPEIRMSSAEELAIFVKRWRPSTYTTDQLTEIIIPRSTVDGLKEKLSEISGMEAENIEVAKGKGTFPSDMSVIDITNDLDWTVRSGPLDQRPFYILDDGAMIYYRDKTEKLKELTEDERRELVNTENRRLNRDQQYTCPSASTSTYSTLRSKEKGLKIYLNHED